VQEAAPIATAEALDVKQTEGGELLFTFGERVWRIRGWQKNLGPEQMRVNVHRQRRACRVRVF
jgi:DNA primase